MGLLASFSAGRRRPELSRPSGICRLCAATTEQYRQVREEKGGWGQWLFRCGHCGAIYLDPDMTAEGLGQFYQYSYRRFYPFEVSTRLDERFLHAVRCFEVGYRRARALVGALPVGGRLLEVGSGYGGFLAAVGNLRPDVERLAIEPDLGNRMAALQPKETGQQAAAKPVAFIDWQGLGQHGPFDLIVLFHTLEHVLDPVADLRHLGAVLASGGRLVFEVPETVPQALTMGEIHPAHVTYFTARTVRAVVERAGLVPLQAQFARGALPGCLWQEAATATHLPETHPQPAVLSEPLIPPSPTSGVKRVVRGMVRAVLPLPWQGKLSRWRQGPILDRCLREILPGGERLFCWGLPFDPHWTMGSLLQQASAAMAAKTPLRVADMNVAKVLAARDTSAFRRSLLTAQAVVVDGMGVLWGLHWLGIPAQRIAGADLLGEALALCEREERRVYVVGARPDVIERAALQMQARYPALKLVGWRDGYFKPDQDAEVARQIAASGADCVITALPYPRQDIFLAQIHQASGAAFVFGVGGSLDVFVGDLRRAPVWVQRAGMEWLYRLLQEPQRLAGRYLATNSAFAWLLIKEKVAQWLANRRHQG